MSFSEYLSIKTAVDAGDEQTIRRMIDSKMQMEGNSYTAAIKAVEPTSPNNDEEIEGEEGEEEESDIPFVPPTNKDEAIAEIDRIKQLAGISDDSVDEGIGSPTPMTCKSMSRDGSTTPNQIVKRHRKREKPGPEKGSTYAKKTKH
jgi:hypothetical protein